MSETLHQNMETHHPPLLRIAYLPTEDIGNSYTIRMRDILSSLGIVEPYEGTKSSFLNFLKGRKKYDLIIANWTDNEIVSKTSRTNISIAGTIKIFAKAIIMRLTAGKVIFIRHNNHPHALTGKSAANAKWLIDRYEAFFSIVLTHSGAHTENRRRYCPHPLYNKVDVNPISKPLTIIPSKKYFVSFGRISSYKNLGKLMSGFPEEKTLLVIGSVGDQAYVDQLRKIRRPNLIFSPGYLSEADAQTIVMKSEGVVISHADSDVVVSGTFFYAMSIHCRVFAVATPFLAWVQPLIGNGIITLGSNVAEVCELIDSAETFDASAALWASVDAEFGDDSVRSYLAKAMAVGGAPHG